MLGPLLGVVGFVILAGAIAYLWVRPVELPPMPPAPPDESGAVASLKSEVGTLKTQLASLDAREKSDVASLQSAIAAASQSGASQSGASQSGAPQAGAPQTKAAGSNASGSDASGQGAPEASGSGAAAAAAMAATDALHEQVAALSGRLDQIQSAETAQAKQTQALPSAADVTSLTSRVQAVAQQQSEETASVRQDLNGVQQQLTKLSDQSQTLSKNATALSQLTSKADRLSQILRAQAALRAGMPLGTIDNAPQALTRFANSAPPTEAALRVSFPEAAKAAEKAGEPTPDQGTFWHRVWLRMQGLVTVRQGDRVILGDPTGAILAHAQRLLDAGDLSGSLDALGKLTGPAAVAMAPWEARAKALLDAQQALAKMAAS
ncbi:MAG: hypothetical protein HIU92_15345 [Proteobacteria bacterium]|nr:hypothetical protein [Pseudomonadota bacterium]